MTGWLTLSPISPGLLQGLRQGLDVRCGGGRCVPRILAPHSSPSHLRVSLGIREYMGFCGGDRTWILSDWRIWLVTRSLIYGPLQHTAILHMQGAQTSPSGTPGLEPDKPQPHPTPLPDSVLAAWPGPNLERISPPGTLEGGRQSFPGPGGCIAGHSGLWAPLPTSFTSRRAGSKPISVQGRCRPWL